MFKNEEFRKAYFEQSAYKENSDFYVNLTDGEVFKEGLLFKSNKRALQIQFFFDEFEVCNPLGNKADNHKIGAFYFTINNFPQNINSRLENIHLLALCFNEKFGINSVLGVIVNDLKTLETSGIFVDEQASILNGTLVSLSHDNLGAAVLFGMVQSFQANHYCRICKMHKLDAQISFTQDSSLVRVSSNFQLQTKKIKNEGSAYGVKEKTALCDLNFYKLSNNPTVDIMHDI